MVTGVLWNAAGRGLPLLLALALTPVLIGQLGVERWGLFTLALAMVGVFGVFDFGVGQALTRALSERLGQAGDDPGRMVEATELVVAALAALLLVSLGVAGIVWWCVPVLVERVLLVPAALQPQAVSAMRVLTATAPLVVANAALWGVLAAHQRFRAANLATIPVSLFYYLGPVLVLLMWDDLTAVMLALVACRLANTISYAWLVRPLLPGLRLRWPRFGLVAPLLRLGGWMTASGLLGQALLYADRFLIGALLSLAAVAYYATPLDLVLRLWILPVAVAQTLLPALASSFATLPVQTAALLRRGALLIMAVVLPACLLLVAGADPVLRLWLGADFALGGARVLQILSVGMFFSCAAFAPNSLIDAVGRPDVTALFALAQALVFLPLAALLLSWQGIEGAALAWALRCAVDCAGKLAIAARLYPAAAGAVRQVVAPLAGGGLGLTTLLLLPGLAATLVAGAVVAMAFAVLAARALDAGERAVLLRHPFALLRARPAGGAP